MTLFGMIIKIPMKFFFIESRGVTNTGAAGGEQTALSDVWV